MSGIVAAARALIGVRFRLHGRDPATGLDCVGLAAAAADVAVPTGYSLRGGDPKRIAAVCRAYGFRQADDMRPGDLLLLRPGPAQLHLAVKTDTGFVHADAGLRRVVERPGVPEWEVVQIWRR